MNTMARWLVATAGVLFGCSAAFGQAEVSASGGLRGIRIDGELMAFKTGVRVAGSPGPGGAEQAEMLGNVQFHREGNQQICEGGIRLGDFRRGFAYVFRAPSQLGCRMVFEDAGVGVVNVDVRIKVNADVKTDGVNFYLHLPAADYAKGSVVLIDSDASAIGQIPLTATRPSEKHYLSVMAGGLRFLSAHRQLEMRLDSPREIVFGDDRRKPDGDLDIYFPLATGPLTEGQEIRARITFRSSGDVDRSQANVVIDPSRPGSEFDGMGGNFRLQSPGDPLEIQYNLRNMRVAWGRVAMPLNFWQPKEDVDSTQAADSGKMNGEVQSAMEMARTLALKKIPMIISVWSAPDWALMPRQGGRRFFFGGGRKINPKKYDEVCKSIGSYLEYLKVHYGAEPKYFSFNESDLGIQVLQTPADHAEAIKRLGAYFASHGLVTKMVLGDTSDPKPFKFIDVAMGDPEAVKYVGAVSFHSWHGGTVGQFTHWGRAAKKLGVPLLVGEGGTDSNSYAYPNIFLEPWYGLEEISEYVEICRICQPEAILQWQLTGNYSLLTGGEDGNPLAPTERFWLLRQLGSMPAGAKAIPVSCDKKEIVACAFFGDGKYWVDLVNNGATRVVAVSGLPEGVTELRVLVTDGGRGMKDMGMVAVGGGAAQVTLDSGSFTTLVSDP
jgi:hypothetical protein